jgi:hypothetical protein
MPPKVPGRDTGVETDEVLQAVVIAETFNQRFQPLTANKPRVGRIPRSFLMLQLIYH